MPTKCVAHGKNSHNDSRSLEHFRPLNEVVTDVRNRRLLQLLPIETDTHQDQPRDPYEGRESYSAEAFLRGCRVQRQLFVSPEASNDCYLASMELIEKSQALILASKQRVRRIRADMALRRLPGQKIN
jgi:hypothetical protein